VFESLWLEAEAMATCHRVRTRSSTRGLTSSIKPPDMIRTLETMY
jgi:hypothetical protein